MQLILVGMCLGLASTHLFALEGEEFLREFWQNPKAMIDRSLPKYQSDGRKAGDLSKWPKATAKFQEHTKVIKDAIDKKILGEGKQKWQRHDSPHRLFAKGVEVETDIFKLKESAQLSTIPWSAYYWPIANGGISARYGDPAFVEKLASELEKESIIKYKSVVDYYKQPEDFFQLTQERRNTQKLDLYSPAEKYDLLVGDLDFGLTNYTKKNGFRWEEEDGSVAMWMGICHGWAVASYASPRPSRTVKVKSLRGDTVVNFHPDDLRALVSLKWSASSSFEKFFIGGRCNANNAEEEVTKDEKTGRITQKECFDTNPGTWHIVVANKIGRYDESFIMDATFDAEVWNQPVYAYELYYFNPKTFQVGTLEESIVPMDKAWKEMDIFAHLRKNRKAKKIVAVQMNVTYVAENDPQHGKPLPDSLITVVYQYDLELDKNNNIVGGEWYTNMHPDFLWAQKSGSKPQNEVDRRIAQLIKKRQVIAKFSATKDAKTLNTALLDKLTDLAKISLLMDATPLEIVLDSLVELSVEKK